MKELKKKKPGPLDVPKPKQAPPLKRREKDASDLSHGDITDANDQASLFSNECLSHSANAEPLASLLGQLQQSHGNVYVQRFVSSVKDSRAEAEAPSETQRLDPATKAKMESSFGVDLGEVRLHTGEAAEEAAKKESARAFTRGRDISFAAGEYEPSSPEGLELIAHEVAHIVQQRKREQSEQEQSEREQSEQAPSHDSAESEAHELGRLVASGHKVQVKQTADASAIHRMPAAPQPTTQPQAGRAETTQKKAAPQPKAPAKKKAPDFELTDAIQSAARRLATDRLYEDQQVELYVATEDKRPALIINHIMHLFAGVWQEIIKQQPADVNRATFLGAAGQMIWAFVRDMLTQQVSQRYQSNAAFRQKVDRARGKATPAAPLAGGSKT
jgi:hypothetical protein